MRPAPLDRPDLQEAFSAVLQDFALKRQLLQRRPLYQSLVSLGAAAVEADESSVFLLDEEGEHLEIVLGRHQGRTLVGLRQPLRSGIVSMVVWSEQGINVADVTVEPSFDDTIDRTAGYETRSMLAVPVRAGGRLQAVLTAVNKRSAVPFSDEDFARLATVAECLGEVLRADLVSEIAQL